MQSVRRRFDVINLFGLFIKPLGSLYRFISRRQGNNFIILRIFKQFFKRIYFRLCFIADVVLPVRFFLIAVVKRNKAINIVFIIMDIVFQCMISFQASFAL